MALLWTVIGLHVHKIFKIKLFFFFLNLNYSAKTKEVVRVAEVPELGLYLDYSIFQVESHLAELKINIFKITMKIFLGIVFKIQKKGIQAVHEV